jgi:hypothetical protein
MKSEVKFQWEGATEHEAGIAFYEIDKLTYSLGFPSFRAANLVHMVLSDAYRAGYLAGSRSARAALQSALSKLPE